LLTILTMTKLQQGNKIVITMLNKHENPSETSKSKRQKQKQNECMTKILNNNVTLV
jgi:type IV secretory pathway component VirB8